MKKYLILAIAILFLLPAFCMAEEAVLTWNKPDDDRITGYNVYVGDSAESVVLPESLNGSVNDSDVCTYTITDLTAGQHIYITATSFDADGNQSAFSDILDAVMPDLSLPDVIVIPTQLGGIQISIELIP